MFKDYLGIPFKDGGRTMAGVDCWGLVKLIYSIEYSITLPDFCIGCTDSYGVNVAVKSEMEAPRWGKINGPVEGAIVLINVNKIHDVINHIGVCTGPGKFIHTLKKHGVSIVPLTHYFFKSRIRGYYKWL